MQITPTDATGTSSAAQRIPGSATAPFAAAAAAPPTATCPTATATSIRTARLPRLRGDTQQPSRVCVHVHAARLQWCPRAALAIR